MQNNDHDDPASVNADHQIGGNDAVADESNLQGGPPLADRASSDSSSAGEGSTGEGQQAALPDLEPMSMAMLGRLFGVPFIIVGVIVLGAVMVVFLFGAPTLVKATTVDDLLNELEGSSGAKSAGILLPNEKKLWQTALELGKRLEKRDTEFEEAELITIAERLTGIIRNDLTHVDTFPTEDHRIKQKELRNTRLQFIIRALSRTGRPEAIEPLIEVIENGSAPFTQVAIQEVGNLYELPESRKAIEPLLAILVDWKARTSEELLSSATVVSVLAASGNDPVIKALEAVRLNVPGEVEWSAALAQARLGSAQGKTTLRDMLSREFWETGDRYLVYDEKGQARRYPMPPQRINDFLIASIDAASHTSDPDLWELIEGLKSDASTAVRGHAAEALTKAATRPNSVPVAEGS